MQAAEKMEESQVSEILEFKIERSELLRGLGHVQSVVERRGTIPILSNIKLDAGESQLELTATDMDISVQEKVEASVLTQGAITLSAQTLYEIIRKLPDGAEISVKADGNGKASVSAGRSRFSLSTLPVEDFPSMMDADLPHSFVLSSAECKSLIEKTKFAMSTEETRYYLNGVYLHTIEDGNNNVLRAVATDGHRLARQEVALPAGASEMPDIIIPRKTIGELVKLIEEGLTEVKISLSENKIRFVCGSAILVSKLIDGTFPDYTRVIPENNDRIMEINADIFSKAVDRVSIISSDKTRGVKVSLKSGEMILSASSPEQGTAREQLEVSYDAEEVEIGFNSRYLIDVLSQIDGDIVQIILADETAPALIKDSGDSGALYVVMPMRV